MKNHKPRKVPTRVMKPRVGREENAIRAIYVIYKLLSRQGSRWRSWPFIAEWKDGKWREREFRSHQPLMARVEVRNLHT